MDSAKEKTLRERLHEEIVTLRTKNDAEIKVKEQFLQLIDRFPDLARHRDPWGSDFYTSRKIVQITTDCKFEHSCSCCRSSSLFVYPFIEIDGVRLYSEPTRIYIGEQSNFGGDIPNDGWKKRLEALDLPAIIIAKVEQYFADNPPRTEESEF